MSKKCYEVDVMEECGEGLCKCCECDKCTECGLCFKYGCSEFERSDNNEGS